MGAIKEYSYTLEETDLFFVARAFAHPARVKMITELLVERPYRNIDLSKMLNLSNASMHSHILKLRDAGLVDIDYSMHYYLIMLNDKGNIWSEMFLSQKFIGEESR